MIKLDTYSCIFDVLHFICVIHYINRCSNKLENILDSPFISFKNSQKMIFFGKEREKKSGWVFLSKCRRGGFVAGEGLSWGGFVAGVRLSLGCVCRWGRFVVGWVCRGEGLSGVGLSVYQMHYFGIFEGLQTLLVSKYQNDS